MEKEYVYELRKEKKKRQWVGCPTPQNKWVPFLDDSMGSQIFQVKLNLVHQNPSWRCLSVPDTAAQLTHLCHSTSNRHTYTHSSVQTFLCSSQWENMSKRTNYSSGYTHPSTHCKENDRYTYTDTDIAGKWSLFIIFPNIVKVCFSEAIQIRILFFFFAQSYIPVKVHNTDLTQTGSSFKKVSNRYSQFPLSNL